MEPINYLGLTDLLASGPAALAQVPMGWMVSRTLLAVLLLAALAVERYMPTARKPSKETAGALLVVTIAAYLTSAAFLAAPASPAVHGASIFSRPWDLLPGALFLFAAIFFRQRLKNDPKEKNPASLSAYSLFRRAALDCICHRSATVSQHLANSP